MTFISLKQSSFNKIKNTLFQSKLFQSFKCSTSHLDALKHHKTRTILYNSYKYIWFTLFLLFVKLITKNLIQVHKKMKFEIKFVIL